MPSVAKHSNPTPTSGGQRILALLVAVAVLVGGISIYRLLVGDRDEDGTGSTATGTSDVDDSAVTSDPPPAADDDARSGEVECGQVTVWAAPELLPAVESAAGRATDDCFSYAVVSRTAPTARSALRDGETPDVWLPSSVAWPQLMAEEGVDLEIGQTVASSPVLLAGRPQVVAGLGELGVTPESTFAEVLQSYQAAVATGGSDVAVRLGDPRTDPATMALLTATSDQLGGLDESGSAGRNLLVVLAQTAVPGEPVSALASEETLVVPATEQQIGAAAQEDLELEGVSLAGGVGTVTMPFVRVADTGSAAAVDALEQQLTSEEAATDLADLQLRAGTDGEAPDVAGVPEGLTVDGEAPDPATTNLLAQTWTLIAPQSRILALIDISGSMEAPVDGDVTRIDLTREAAQTALSVIPQRTAIGVWYFATALDGDRDYREAVPMRPLNEEVRSGVTQLDAVLSVTEDLDLDILEGDTGLHDSLWAAYQQMQEDYSPEAISSVLLLTDGINDDSTGGLSEDEVVERLTEARETGERPVTVVLIGMGPDVDEEALERLAAAAGGEALVLRDPRELPQVFVDIVARRAP